jgi:hypothetical protein
MAALDRIVIECSFAKRLAAFWAAAAGYSMATVTRHGRAALEHPRGLAPRLLFVEADGRHRSERGRLLVGLDLVADEPEQEARVLCGLGATLVGTDDQDGEPCLVLADPEQNLFRVFRRPAGEPEERLP